MSTTGPISTASNAEQPPRVGIGLEANQQRYTIVPQETVSEFNPKKEKWCEYKERFENACDLHNIQDKKMGKSLLIGALTPETYRKIRVSVAPKKPLDLSLNELINLLDTIYEPERNNLIARMKILDMKQEQDESIQSYSERLKEGLSHCYLDNVADAKDMLATMVFTRGLRNDEMKKGILQQHSIEPNSSF